MAATILTPKHLTRIVRRCTGTRAAGWHKLTPKHMTRNVPAYVNYHMCGCMIAHV